jgi:phosphotransferase system enzyme I (PtsI)
MAGDIAFTELLLGMGLRSLSMHPSQISSVKQRILRADTARLSSTAEKALASSEPAVSWQSTVGATSQRTRSADGRS